MKLENLDKTYHRLSLNVYGINQSKKEVSLDLEQGDKIFKVLESRIDHENGFKAMAVTPIKTDGSWDKDEMYFAFAGTSLLEDETADIGADIHLTTSNYLPNQHIKYPVKNDKKYSNLNTKVINKSYSENLPKDIGHINQFDESAIWVKAVIDKYQPKHKYGTGHSLGGGIAMPMGVMFDFDQVRTFSAPNTFSLLPPEFRENFDNSRYVKRFFDYAHYHDVIGTESFGRPQIGKEFVISSKVESLNPIRGHSLESFLFSGNDIVIKMDYHALNAIHDDLHKSVSFIQKAIASYDEYIEETERKTKAIENKYVEKISNGGYQYISSTDIYDYMDELSKTGHYDFYSESDFDSVKAKLRHVKQSSEEIADKLKAAADFMQETEAAMSRKYRLDKPHYGLS
ncbi:alpha/beta hydrolase family protein [Staphylococcus simulans]